MSHVSNQGQVLQRYYGWYANRTRGRRRRADVPEPAPMVEPTPIGAAAAAAPVDFPREPHALAGSGTPRDGWPSGEASGRRPWLARTLGGSIEIPKPILRLLITIARKSQEAIP